MNHQLERMARVETIPDVPREEEDSYQRRSPCSSNVRDSVQTITSGGEKAEDGGGCWSVRNGSLPVPVPSTAASSTQTGAGLHHVESSTTDSGVSNASSVTSDSVPPLVAEEEEEDEDGRLVTTELRLELRTVEQALGHLSEGENERGDGIPSGERGRERGEGGTEGGSASGGAERNGSMIEGEHTLSSFMYV